MLSAQRSLGSPDVGNSFRWSQIAEKRKFISDPNAVTCSPFDRARGEASVAARPLFDGLWALLVPEFRSTSIFCGGQGLHHEYRLEPKAA
jgi:hypothetical protein